MLLGILFAVSCLLPTGKSEGPVLNVTEKDIDVPLGSTLYLKCSGEYPLAWKVRYLLKEKESPLEAFTTSKAALFESIIRLEFHTSAATGRYICFYRNASRTDSTSIYIFVTCLLPTGKSEGPVLNVTEKDIDVPLGSTLYLKCSGEYPLAWKVRYLLKEKESPLEAFTTSKAALFESIIRLEFHTSAATGRYICFYRNASRTDSTSIYIFVTCLLPTGKSEGPVLNVTEKYIDVPLGSTLYLKCSGEYPLAWKFRYPLKEKESPLEAFTTSKAALFESIIRLEFHNYAATGRYICFYRNACWTVSTTIYIFVNSEDHLLLPVDGYPFEIILMDEREVTTIPCLPSYSVAEVSLQKSTVSAIELNSEVDFCNETIALKENIPFDPTEGFKISNSTSYYRGPFCCEAALGELKEKIVFILAIKSSDSTTYAVMNQMGYPVAGSTFCIDCYLLKGREAFLSNFHYGWSYPVAAANRIIIDEIPTIDYKAFSLPFHRTTRTPVRFKRVTIHNATKTVGGFYRCSAMTSSYEVHISETFVPIYDVKEYPYLAAEGASVEFKADYRTFPITTLYTWTKNTGSSGYGKPWKYEMFHKDDAYILRIHNVSNKDSDNYRFSFWAIGFRTITYFRFSVIPATPQIFVGNADAARLKDVSNLTVYCRTEKNLWAHMEWLWRPISDNACDECVRFEVILENDISVPEELEAQWGKHYIAHSIKSIPGKYLCRGTDEFGSAEKTASTILAREKLRPQNFAPIFRVNQLDTITLSCAANKSLYNNIEIWWRRSNYDSFEQVNRSIVYSKNEDELKANYRFEMIAYEQTGTYRCSASYRDNSSKTAEKSIFIFVNGPEHRVIYFTNMDVDEVLGYVNETVEFFCYGNAEDPGVCSGRCPVVDVAWNFNNTSLLPNTFGTTYADDYQKLVIKHLSTENTGDYECILQGRTQNLTGEIYTTEFRRIKLFVKTSPRIWKTNMNFSTVGVQLRGSIDLLCYVDDLRGTNITWYHNNSILDTSIPGVNLDYDFQKLQIAGLTEESSGVYECRVENKLGFASARITLLINKTPGKTDISRTVGFAVLGAAVLVISSVFMAVILLRRYTSQKFQNDESVADLVDAETSSEEEVDYEVSPEDVMLCNQILPDAGKQLDLAYDTKMEFPKDRLKFGKSLGSGEFGRVIKAKAVGIHDFEPSTVVAVKMAKERGNPVHEAALNQELKILILMGYHLNIMNLLGAVTRNPKGLMIIVEYCRHGNLRDFLRKHKNQFVPQETELSDNYEEENQLKVFTESTRLEDDGERSIPQPPSSLDTAALGQQNTTEKLNETTYNNLPCGSSAGHSSGNAAAKCPKRRRRRGIRLFASDLISYAFQCARGMSYLASKKLIHRDLAARNILLAEGNVIKICDYGLTKDIYNYPNYIPRKDLPLPFKWMAIESLGDRVFTTKSDVWSFGVVLWELFSLGKNPYPSIPADEHFYGILKDGYRMSKPEFATEDIYQIMRNCWRENPGERPSFSELTKLLGHLLEDAVRQRYIKLNEPYAKRNEQSALFHPERTEQNESLENFTDSKNPTTIQDHRDDLGATLLNSGDVKTPSEAFPLHKPLCNFEDNCSPQIQYMEETV